MHEGIIQQKCQNEEDKMAFECFNDRDDVKWSHPEIEEIYAAAAAPGGFDTFTLNPDVPFEERKAAMDAGNAESDAAAEAALTDEQKARRTICMAPGCEEDPEAPLVKVTVVKPAEVTKKKYPCILLVPAGALCVRVEGPTLYQLSDTYDCVAVRVDYRTLFEGGEYPAPINDLHAAYNYLLAHAEELNIDPKKIIIRGTSSGGILGLSLAHRLKRYGIKPRGVLAIVPCLETRGNYPSMHIQSVSWAAQQNNLMGKMYLGPKALDATTSPEAMANFATVEDCVGMPPVFIHDFMNDIYADPAMEYASKLNQAGVYCDIHVWGGSNHTGLYFSEIQNRGNAEMPHSNAFITVIDDQINSLLKYDLSRPWAVEDAKAELAARAEKLGK